MFEISYVTNVPIKVWLNCSSELEISCLEEAVNIANLPFVKEHVSLMSDCHASGYNMPIGGVVATRDVIVPDFISNDCGCGVAFVQTNIPVEWLNRKINNNGTIKQILVGQLMRNIPTGFQHRKKKDNEHNYDLLDIIERYQYEYDGGLWETVPSEMNQAIDAAYECVGTLGSGNHFLEIQRNLDDDTIGIMIHSGSRQVGSIVHKYFNNKAKELNEQWYINTIAPEINVPFLPIKSEVGKEYFHWMNFALEIAKLNRKVMMDIVKEELYKLIDKLFDNPKYNIVESMDVDIHHNYAAMENVNGKNYLVHRKGAVRARNNDIIPVPGAMGSYSYICRGLQNTDSFHSSPHGAGRKMTRTDAFKKFTTQQTMEDLKENNVILGKNDKSKVADESRWSYKNIDEVIENSKTLIKPLKKLKTEIVIKG